VGERWLRGGEGSGLEEGVFGVVTGDHHVLGEPRYAVLGDAVLGVAG
jgi:hypothetical protein